ncbi:MAG TPA: hypothetical protein DCS55_02815 [Acidimicrobiaceae bacterium]|nr:hypothetical protein [Acidimicrobiaceae bacterium]
MALITDLDDRTLVEQHRAGDADAFRRIVERHHRSLYANALRRLGDPVAAEDAVQDAFLRAFRNLERFDGDYHLDAWLHRIVTNTCHDIGRRRGRDTRLFDRACTEVEVEAAPADEAMDAMPREQIAEALDALPESYREVLMLRFVDELPYAEVAEKAGISEQNARARVSRGRTMLKRMLTSTSALVVWAIPPLRRQTQLTGAEAEAANQAAAQVHGIATIAASAPAPAHAFTQVSGIIAQAGPAIATAAPAASSTAPAFGKAAMAVGLAAAAAIPAGVAVDRAREPKAPVDPTTQTSADRSTAAAPSDPVVVDPPKTQTSAPSTTAEAGGEVGVLSVGGVADIDSTDAATTDASTSTTAAPSTSVPAEQGATTPPPSAPPSTVPPAEEPVAETPPRPTPDPGAVSATLHVTEDGPRLGLDGGITIAVGDASYVGHLSGKLSVGPADPKNPQAQRQVEVSTLTIVIDGRSFDLMVSGWTTVTEQGNGQLFDLQLNYRLVGAADLGLAETGAATGTLDIRHGEGTLSLTLPGADGGAST